MGEAILSFQWSVGLTIGLLILLLVTGIVAIRVRDLLISCIMLGIFSLLMALIYLFMDAPDVAMTEAAVGAGISTLLVLSAIALKGRIEKDPSWGSLSALCVVVAMGSILLFAVGDMPLYGDVEAPVHHYVGPYYLGQSGEDIGIPNVVASILASYRGFDTLGETTVILTAALAVGLLLGRKKTGGSK